jgi:hypothetical protein
MLSNKKTGSSLPLTLAVQKLGAQEKGRLDPVFL